MLLKISFAFTALSALSFPTLSSAAKSSRTFAVLRFNGPEIHNGRIDPIVNHAGVSNHVHTVQGSTGFSATSTGKSLKAANCTNAKLAADHSNYWYPRLYFRDPQNGTLEAVPMFYTNAYYFFEPTDDDIKAFPTGLSMLSGNVSLRSPPASGTGAQNLDPANGDIQPVGITCPRSSFDPPSWPADSDGLTLGIQDPNNKGQGAGFPNQECDGFASPLRTDIHFPSCYDPDAGLTNYQHNTAWPSSQGASQGGRQNCPDGWIHTPHLFMEVYWNTPLFQSRWTRGQDNQPFVLSNGDATGYSLHADFMAGWDEDVLQHVIDTCDAGDAGMDQCAGVELNSDTCTVPPIIHEDVDGPFQELPGGVQLSGWKYGSYSGSPVSSSSSATATAKATSSAYANNTPSSSSTAAAAAAASSTPAAVADDAYFASSAAPSVEATPSYTRNLTMTSLLPTASSLATVTTVKACKTPTTRTVWTTAYDDEVTAEPTTTTEATTTVSATATTRLAGYGQ